MEWSQAKRFVIMLLILLNGMLAGLNYQKKQENMLTSNQEKAIFKVLSDNGITLYTELLTKFTPMRKLSLSIPAYGKEDVKRLFFSNEETTVTMEFDKTIIKGKNKTLTMKGNKGNLVFLKGTKEVPELNKATALKVAADLIEKLGKEVGTLEPGIVIETEGGYCVTFFEHYKGQTVFASCYQVYVTPKGIEKVDFTYCKPEGYSGGKKEICFSDEALLTFMRELRKERDGGFIAVTKMELGYDFQDSEEEIADTMIKLVPCYRIYIMGKEKPYIINAYTNEMVPTQGETQKSEN